MDRVELLKRYQAFNPLTRRFDLHRTNREYAELLGIHESYLSKCYDYKHPVGLKALEGLARAFPQAASEIAFSLAQPPREPIEVPA